MMKKPILISLTALASLALAALACTPVTVTVNGEPIGENESEVTEVVSNQAGQATDLQAAFESLPAGDVENGEDLFNDKACHTCHADVPIGPAFPGSPALVERAETRVPGYSAELYLYESIVSPQVFVVSGYDGEVMPKDFGAELSAQQLADLIAYLMTMK